MKDIDQSKTFWFNIITTMVETVILTQTIIGTVNDQIPPMHLLYTTLALMFLKGFGNIILRVYFTNTGINKP